MMTVRPISILDVATRSRWFRNTALRRITFAMLLVVLALLSLFPRIYAADVKLAPQESNTAGLSAILTQLGGNYAALLGRSQPVEVDLAIARSFEVKRNVVRQLGTKADDGSRELHDAIMDLEDHTEIQAMRGNLIEIVVRDRDADRALDTIKAYSAAMQQRLAQLSRQSTDNKKAILDERFAESQARLARAEGAVNSFRRANQLVAPEAQMSSALGQLAGLQGQLQGKQIQLQTALQFNTPEAFGVRSLRAEIAALNAQVNQADRMVRTSGGMTAAGIAPVALRFEALNRELRFSQALYESYTRYLEGAAIENLTAEYNLQQIEPPYIRPGVQYNAIPLGLLMFVGLIAIAAEFIVIRPPSGISTPLPTG